MHKGWDHACQTTARGETARKIHSAYRRRGIVRSGACSRYRGSGARQDIQPAVVYTFYRIARYNRRSIFICIQLSARSGALRHDRAARRPRDHSECFGGARQPRGDLPALRSVYPRGQRILQQMREQTLTLRTLRVRPIPKNFLRKFQTEISLKIFFVILGESSIVFSVYDRISEPPWGHPMAAAIASPASENASLSSKIR